MAHSLLYLYFILIMKHVSSTLVCWSLIHLHNLKSPSNRIFYHFQDNQYAQSHQLINKNLKKCHTSSLDLPKPRSKALKTHVSPLPLTFLSPIHTLALPYYKLFISYLEWELYLQEMGRKWKTKINFVM